MYVTFLYKKMHNVKNELWPVLIFSWAKSVQKPSFAISNKALTRRPVFAIKWLDYFEFETSVFNAKRSEIKRSQIRNSVSKWGKEGRWRFKRKVKI